MLNDFFLAEWSILLIINEALWSGNFRDLSSAITRIFTLADSSRITIDNVDGLKHTWNPSSQQGIYQY